MELNCESFGDNIKKYRALAGLRQEDLAEQCDCSNSFIGQIENGRACPSLKMTVRIANALDVTLDQLMADSIKNTKLVIMGSIEERVNKLPTPIQITACREMENLLGIIERIHEK